MVDVVSVLFIARANEVEVANNHPRASDHERKVKKFLEEGAGMTVVRGAINICNM